MIDNMELNTCLVFFRILAFMPSIPHDEEFFNWLITFTIPSELNSIFGIGGKAKCGKSGSSLLGSLVKTEQNAELTDGTSQSATGDPEVSQRETVVLSSGFIIFQKRRGYVHVLPCTYIVTGITIIMYYQ